MKLLCLIVWDIKKKNKISILQSLTEQKQIAEEINYVMAECVNHESNRSVASEAKAEKCGLIES